MTGCKKASVGPIELFNGLRSRHNPLADGTPGVLQLNATIMFMRLLVSFTKGIMLAIGITLPKPEQEKTVAIVWVVAFFAMIGIVCAVSWAVLTSFSNSAR